MRKKMSPETLVLRRAWRERTAKIWLIRHH
jgi:hypothetical protein